MREPLLLGGVVGVVVVGPWACLVLNRALGRVVHCTATLIAVRRIAADLR